MLSAPAHVGRYESFSSLRCVAQIGQSLYVGQPGGQLIFDIADRQRPVQHRQLLGLYDPCRMKIYGTRGYMLSGVGMEIYDVSDPLSSNGIIYGMTSTGDVCLVDIRRPMIPIALCPDVTIAGFSDFDVVDDTLYVATSGSGLQVYQMDQDALPRLSPPLHLPLIGR